MSSWSMEHILSYGQGSTNTFWNDMGGDGKASRKLYISVLARASDHAKTSQCSHL